MVHMGARGCNSKRFQHTCFPADEMCDEMQLGLTNDSLVAAQHEPEVRSPRACEKRQGLRCDRGARGPGNGRAAGCGVRDSNDCGDRDARGEKACVAKRSVDGGECLELATQNTSKVGWSNKPWKACGNPERALDEPRWRALHLDR